MRPRFYDHILVSLDTPEQAALWTSELGVSLATLKLALHNAGPVLNDIRAELGLARIYIFPRDDRVMQRILSHSAI
jgi:hypothetical protein